MKNTEKIIWNRLLLALVTVLLGLSIIILLKIVFFPFGFDVKDWGTRSDLLSSISTAIAAVGTLGTLIIAGMAYKKAPDWINQKKHETAYDIAKDLLLTDYSTMSEKMLLASKYCDIYSEVVYSSPNDIESIFTSDDCQKKIDNFDLIIINPQHLHLKIDTLKKMGWVIKPDALELIHNIHHFFNFASMSYRASWLRLDYFVSGNQSDSIEKQTAFLSTLFDRPTKHINDFFKEYKKLKNYNDAIENYFIIKK